MAAPENLEKADVILEHDDDFKASPRVAKPSNALSHDVVAPEAIGGLYGEMPKGYYWSTEFIGTLIVRHSHR